MNYKLEKILSIILIINGVYDIICAVSILYFPKVLFAKIHTKMYIDSSTLLSNHFLAYWILTNGIIRLFSGIYSKMYFAAAITYFVEIFVFINEMTTEKMKLLHVFFVVITSFIIGTLLIYFSK